MTILYDYILFVQEDDKSYKNTPLELLQDIYPLKQLNPSQLTVIGD